MLSIGGLDPNDGTSSTPSKDTQSQGFAFFDLTNLAWETSFNASSPPYTSPQVVKDWYNNK